MGNGSDNYIFQNMEEDYVSQATVFLGLSISLGNASFFTYTKIV